jgi:oxygen-independent coproporphyrinogen-3 oxidase
MEKLTQDQQLNEYIMTSLRTIEGLSLTTVTHKWGVDKANKIILESNKHTNLGFAKLANNQLCLTPTGKLMADGIASDLFF